MLQCQKMVYLRAQGQRKQRLDAKSKHVTPSVVAPPHQRHNATAQQSSSNWLFKTVCAIFRVVFGGAGLSLLGGLVGYKYKTFENVKKFLEACECE